MSIERTTYNSRVDVLYIYKRLHEALDGDDIAQDISNLYSEMARNFKVDTGITVGKALGWDRSISNDT
tara:strand:+ start:53 stop:256 length:204 start_codon:yes stop_codon:yes gene_type:complete